jgi:hypothetical protein
MMVEGIKAALDFPHDPRRLRVVSFMTDGYIGNEDEILDEIHRRLGAARIFSFGIGSSTNRYLYDDEAGLDDAIKQVALTYGLMSDYTAFIAVDSSARTAGTNGTTVAVPVPVPDGVPYDTTVPNVAADR